MSEATLNELRVESARVNCDVLRAYHKQYGREGTIAMILGGMDALSGALVLLTNHEKAAEQFYRHGDEIVSQKAGVMPSWEA